MHDDSSHLIFFYKDQIAKIRAAFEALEFEECYAIHGLKDLEAAINDKTVEEIADIPRRNQEELDRIRQDRFMHRGKA